MTSAAELRAALPLSCAPSTTCRAPGPCLHVWRYGHKVATVASSCGPSSIGKLCSASCSLRVWTHGKWFDGKKRKGFMSQRRQRLRSASLNCSWRSSTWAWAHSWPWPWLTVAMLRETRAVEHEPHAVPVWQGISDRIKDPEAAQGSIGSCSGVVPSLLPFLLRCQHIGAPRHSQQLLHHC